MASKSSSKANLSAFAAQTSSITHADPDSAQSLISETNDQGLWPILSSYLQSSFSDSAYKQWLRHISFSGTEGHSITLTVPTQFIRDTILNNYFKQIWNFVLQNLPPFKIVEIRVQLQAQKNLDTDHAGNEIALPHHELPKSSQQSSRLPCSPLNDRLTFENFVVGDSNRVAYHSAMRLAMHLAHKAENSKSGSSLNAALDGYGILGEYSSIQGHNLYLYGAVGIGKTHLLQSIAHYLRSNSPGCRWIYMTAERFTQTYVKAVRGNNLIEFKEQLSDLDILLLDDVQFLCGRQGTEREFSNTLDVLAELGKFVVVTCDRIPAELQLEPRTKSRLASGLIVQVIEPDLELRFQILARKAESIPNFYNAEPGDLRLLAERVNTNVRELEGALARVFSHWQIMEGKVDFTDLVNDLTHRNTPRMSETAATAAHPISLDDLVKSVAIQCRTTVAEIRSKKRGGSAGLARQIFAYLARELTDASLKDLGQYLGSRHHATIMYMVDTVSEKLCIDRSLASTVNSIRVSSCSNQATVNVSKVQKIKG